jgi:chromosome segregation ATPase
MTKLASLLGRKPQAGSGTAQPPLAAPPPPPAPGTTPQNVIELDHELFFPIATQLGEENELVRNLLIDAEHKITELDNIRNSLGRLVDPVSKTLRAFEEAKSEKLSLQSVLNNTRIAYSKLREDLTNTERKAATLETECVRLRETLSVAQQSVQALEAAKTEQAAELTSRRGQISELQRMLQQQATDLQLARDESQRALERAALADKKQARLETEAAAATQRFLLADQERATVQGQLDKALAEAAQLSRRLLETDKTLASAQIRMQRLETSLAEALSDRANLTAALDEATETHRKDAIALNAKLEALQARAQLSEKLLEESRQTLAARADEISAFDRRLTEATVTRDAIETKFAQVETALADRDSRIRELEESRAALMAQNTELARAVATRESAYNRAQEKIQSQDDLILMLESEIKAEREASELQSQDLKAQLQREQLDRTMAEGALEAGRKDIARLLRELSALRYRPAASHEGAADAAVSNAA